MAASKRTVLITGCSDGGMGAALAREFHKRGGFHVYATARNPTKMESLQKLGIETLTLDLQSPSSIAECVKQVPHLDILINNAGALYTMPIADISIGDAKALFDLHVWGNLALTQAFLPLLLKSPKALIANHTSTGGGISIPFQAVYCASKAAMSRFSDTLRIELESFNIRVVDLKTGGVATGIIDNRRAQRPTLPMDSIYAPARDLVESAMRTEYAEKLVEPAEQ